MNKFSLTGYFQSYYSSLSKIIILRGSRGTGSASPCSQVLISETVATFREKHALRQCEKNDQSSGI